MERDHPQFMMGPGLFSAPAGGGGGGLIVPFYPTTLYSLRRRKTGYAGSCIRIKRSSDSTQTDIGFDGAGYCDGAAISAFVGVGGTDQGFVTKWYDQSGNGVDLVDTGNTTNVVTNGVLWVFNTKPAIRITTSPASTLSVAANAQFAFGSGSWTWEFFGDPTSNSGLGQGLLDFRDGGSSTGLLYNAAATLPTFFQGANHGTGTPSIIFSSMMYQAVTYDATTMRIFTTGALTYSEVMGITFSGNRPLTIGCGFNGGVPWVGLVVEARITLGTCKYTAAYTPIDYYA